jgi:DNA-binding SARP family transcriptional activator
MPDSPSRDPSQVRIHLTEGRAYVDGRPADLSARELEIILTIAVSPRPVATGEILEAVWPEGDPHRSRLCFRVYVWRIRARLGRSDVLTLSADRWRLGPGVSVDVCDWETLLGTAVSVPLPGREHAALHRALDALLLGACPALANSRLGARLESVIHATARRIGTRLIHDALHRRDAVEALDVARELMAVDPFEEAWHEAVARAHMQLGNGAAAHAALDAYTRLLRTELDEPLPDRLETLRHD